MSKTTWKSALILEFEEEMVASRKILQRVPEDRFTWKPSEKSMTLGRLANHVAALPVGASVAITKQGSRPAEVATTAELLEFFDQRVETARQAFASLTDEQLGGEILVAPTITKPLWAAIRGRGFMNHLIHHRGQLSVYLRLLNVPVPGMYGPSADEK
jgi:uncharacterized damage-inducible protein DinB